MNDILYRPPELDSTCVWDITRQLIKEKKPNDFALSLLRAIFMSGEKQSSGLELGYTYICRPCGPLEIV
jgi:hypothetical protein